MHFIRSTKGLTKGKLRYSALLAALLQQYKLPLCLLNNNFQLLPLSVLLHSHILAVERWNKGIEYPTSWNAYVCNIYVHYSSSFNSTAWAQTQKIQACNKTSLITAQSLNPRSLISDQNSTDTTINTLGATCRCGCRRRMWRFSSLIGATGCQSQTPFRRHEDRLLLKRCRDKTFACGPFCRYVCSSINRCLIVHATEQMIVLNLIVNRLYIHNN